MKNTIEYPEMPTAAESLPQISLVFPFELKMNKKLAFSDMLTLAADEAEMKLYTTYPAERVAPVIKKLRSLIAGIPCPTDKMTLCIFVSPLTEKVYYFTPTKKLSTNLQPTLIKKS